MRSCPWLVPSRWLTSNSPSIESVSRIQRNLFTATYQRETNAHTYCSFASNCIYLCRGFKDTRLWLARTERGRGTLEAGLHARLSLSLTTELSTLSLHRIVKRYTTSYQLCTSWLPLFGIQFSDRSSHWKASSLTSAAAYRPLSPAACRSRS